MIDYFWRIVMDFDKPVLFGFLFRGSQAAVGLVNLFFIARFFSLELQGFYYTFSSLLALQSFLELGLYLVIIAFASHQWADLQIDQSGNVVGDEGALSRLRYLLKFTMVWYFFCSAIFLLLCGTIGYYFLAQSSSSAVTWFYPWLASVSLAAIQLWLMPLICLLEGCNQIFQVNRFKFIQIILEGIAAWILFLLGVGLWVLVGILMVRVISSAIFLFINYYQFFRSIWISPIIDQVNWRDKIWPMQWRLGVQGAFNYFANNAFVPVMFYYHGATIAGQVGMTLQLISTIMIISIIWVQTKVPKLGTYVAQKKFSDLNQIWLRFSTLSFLSATLMCVVLLVIVVLLNIYDYELSNRVLSPELLFVFLISFILLQISDYQSMYLRAFAREAFLYQGVLTGLSVGLAVLIFGGKFGAIGATYSHLAITVCFALPVSSYIWYSKKKAWIQELSSK